MGFLYLSLVRPLLSSNDEVKQSTWNKKEGNIGFVERQNAKGKQIASFFRFGNQVQECIFFSLFRLDRCRVILAANLMHPHWVYWRLIPVFVFNISVAHYSIPGMLYQRRQRKRPSFISTSPSNVQIRRKKKQTNSIQYLQCYTGVCECVRVSSLCTCIIRWSINENQCFFSFCTRSKVVGRMFSLSKRTLKDGVLSSLIPSVGEEEEKRVGPYSSEYCCPTRNKWYISCDHQHTLTMIRWDQVLCGR